MANAQIDRERQEIAYWSGPHDEAPGRRSLSGFTHKMSEAKVLVEKLDRHRSLFESADTVLEMGGGQCWASAMIGQEFGHLRIIGSDISPAAVASAGEWQRVFTTELAGALACRSYQVPLCDSSVDLIVVFASAHHFGAHRRTFLEIRRVLRPGGHALYLHEPACDRLLYGSALRRVNAKRPDVPEDLLRPADLRRLAGEAGLQIAIQAAPTTTYRGPVETLYYYVLQRVPPLQRVLPCSVDVVLTRPGPVEARAAQTVS